MFTIGQVVIHNRDICKVAQVVKKYREDKDYYKLQIMDDSGVTIYTPVESSGELLRLPMTEQEALALVENIPSIPPVEISNFKAGQEYKALVDSGDHTNLVRVIKTSYHRSEQSTANHKKVGENDKVYFRLAERLLYDELAVALNMTYAEARDYVVSRVAALTA